MQTESIDTRYSSVLRTRHGFLKSKLARRVWHIQIYHASKYVCCMLYAHCAFHTTASAAPPPPAAAANHHDTEAEERSGRAVRTLLPGPVPVLLDEARPDVNLLDHYHFLLAICTCLRLLLLVDHELASLIFQHRQHRQRWEQRLRLARIL